MQYTASAIAGTLVELFRGILHPRAHEPRLVGPFPATSNFHSQVDDVVLEGFLVPLWHRFTSLLSWLRVFQRGSVQAYILYILIILSLLLFLTVPMQEALRAIIGRGPP
jgi:hypothetical protein